MVENSRCGYSTVYETMRAAAIGVSHFGQNISDLKLEACYGRGTQDLLAIFFFSE